MILQDLMKSIETFPELIYQSASLQNMIAKAKIYFAQPESLYKLISFLSMVYHLKIFSLMFQLMPSL